jgi:hypothetical protein
MMRRIQTIAMVGLAHSALAQTLEAPAASDSPPPAATQPATQPSANPRRPPAGLLTPISENGGLPVIHSMMYELTAEELAHRAAMRQYARQIRKIRHEYFSVTRVQSIRDQGIALLSEFTDPASFQPLIEELKRERDDVKLGLMDHFALQDEEGQAALAWMAIYDGDSKIRNEALERMTTPVGEPVRYMLNGALRSDKDEVVNAAATLAGALNVIETIPLLIFGQATATGNGETTGDLAWIAFQTQRAFVQGLVPVVGDNSGAFQPVVGTVSDGVVMRVVDAVVIVYRTPVHAALVNLTRNDWGQPTEHMGYNVQAWWDWFNTEYVPFKRRQAELADLAREPGENAPPETRN